MGSVTTRLMSLIRRQLASADYVHNNQRRTRIVVAGDNDSPELLNAAVKNTDSLVHEATYTNAVKARILAKNSGNMGNVGFDPMHSEMLPYKWQQFASDMYLIKHLILNYFYACYQNFDT